MVGGDGDWLLLILPEYKHTHIDPHNQLIPQYKTEEEGRVLDML